MPHKIQPRSPVPNQTSINLTSNQKQRHETPKSL
ncbi:hypothetical protein PDIG_26070 [Penicillium digitatum PHI26]|uniref:Uncharacterized protein n=2 Tax=Penicillium digitatum TaxID=36651 RepID=K9GQW1_PEND2|nr:hypothetical protein PDIP_60550 [Penicillium digitatum Pd1]EKV10339.1 hypothetical protein PDIP_60550 [Penicillium digitatum Pd1]EKV15486.1 hypothetical protein PDIG_26070 [Penicillium digitatum PHI26]